MNRQEARLQYAEALKAGRSGYKRALLHGSYPYLQVLDEILEDSMVAGRVNLGVIEIPADRIVGTKSEGRRNAFSSDFMPLLPENSEFAAKWIALCEAHLGDEGIRDPVRCYEYLGRFYVLEGNKRVSVLKSFGAPTVPANVVRLIPVWSEEPEVALYYEFLRFYELSRLYAVSFSRPGGYARLQAALGFEGDHLWTEEERRGFLSGFSYFQAAFRKQPALPVTAADALLVWLGVYPFGALKTMSAAELAKSLQTVWADVEILCRETPVLVDMVSAEEEKGQSLVGRFVSNLFPTHLTVAFINELDPEESSWVRGHMRGAAYMEEQLGDKVSVLRRHRVGTGAEAETAMEEAVAAGADIIFTTTAPLIGACRKIAARHPYVRIMNCSVDMPYTGVRTYYSRIYEGKFISGAIAGALSRSDELGYVASYPIFGVPAGINAFALGAQLTNPRARVQLRWSCLPGNPIQELTERGIDFISALDLPTLDYPQQKLGACQLQGDGRLKTMASPFWDWGKFYIRIVTSVLNGSWDALNSHRDDRQAVNYWWGMDSDAVGLWLSPDLPEGVRSLVTILKKGIMDGSVNPFHREIRGQDGVLRNDGGRWFSPEEILRMDWLCDRVEGTIPPFEELQPCSRSLVRLQGIYRDSILPEKEGVLL